MSPADQNWPLPAATPGPLSAVPSVNHVYTDPDLVEFLGRLAVTPDGIDAFTGSCLPAWPGRAFGGQLAAQCLSAAAACVPEAMVPWSLHIYFHAPVKANSPVAYSVERVKQGRTLATRRVLVHQDDSLRASATALFAVPGEGPAHEYQRPEIIAAERLPEADRLVDPSILPLDADWKALGYPQKSLVDLRVVEPDATDEYFTRNAWMRVVPELPSDPLTVATSLAYLSDITLGTRVIEPHGGRAHATGLQLGALELALWFTATARLGQWTLFSMYSAFAGGGHGLAHGIFYNSEGNVAAVAAQNALLRRV